MAKSGDPRRRIVLLFVLGIGLPATLLGYLALRGVRNDQALLEQERRDELLRMASIAGELFDSSLGEVGRALDSVLAEVDPGGGSVQASVGALASRRSLIEAVFRLSPDGVVDEFLAPGLIYSADQAPLSWNPSISTARESAGFDTARRMEARDRVSRGALTAYQRIADGPFDPQIRAEAVVGISRVRRAEGDFEAAEAGYRRLKTEFGHVPSDGGIPFRLVALLESGRTELLAGDTVGAAASLVNLYSRLVRTERGLSRAQFALMVANLREPLDEILISPWGNELAALADSVSVLQRDEAAARARTERLLAFQESAGGELMARSSLGPGPEAGEYSRAALSLGGHSFYLLFGAEDLEEIQGMGGRWGILLDPDALEDLVAGTLLNEIGSQEIQWSLRGPSGEVLAASETPPEPAGSGENGIAAVSATLPGVVPPLTIDLSRPENGLVRTLLTSRRGVFFYGFLLLAGIMAFGLILTVVTVSQQLALVRLQSDFVSTVSHELKSPLTAVRQVAETLHSGRVSSEERRQKYYDILLEQSERLSLLIDRVLDFARMESGGHSFSFCPVDVGTFLDEAVSQARHRYAHEGFELREEIQPDLPTASFDADALGQALANLIDNAVKYSGESRKVVVRGFKEDGYVVFAVQDFGIGMNPKEQAHVFDRFYRGGDALTRSVRGTGLGLTLVRQITEGHGGWVGVESEPGQGSTFIIRIPLEGVRE